MGDLRLGRHGDGPFKSSSAAKVHVTPDWFGVFTKSSRWVASETCKTPDMVEYGKTISLQLWYVLEYDNYKDYCEGR